MTTDPAARDAACHQQDTQAPMALERAARQLFAQYSRQFPRWQGLSWESLREDTRRLFRREAEWHRLHPPSAGC